MKCCCCRDTRNARTEQYRLGIINFLKTIRDHWIYNCMTVISDLGTYPLKATHILVIISRSKIKGGFHFPTIGDDRRLFTT